MSEYNIEEVNKLVQYRLNQAEESIQLIDFLVEHKKNQMITNRIYYGMFYALSAVSTKHKVQSSSDIELIEWFRKSVDSLTAFDMKHVEIIEKAYEERVNSDYDAFYEVEELSLMNNFDALKEFVEIVKNHINSVEKKAEEEVAAISADDGDDEADHTILVPWDFSDLAEYALQHALQFNEKAGGKIVLLHILKREKDKEQAEAKLQQIVNNTEEQYGVKISTLTREGTIFTEISAVADELNAKLVVMGTHGLKGMQKFTGSWALKVIVDTKAPFIVIQAPPAHEHLQTVVFPIDHRREIKQKLTQARYLSHYYKVKFILTIADNIGSSLNQKKTKSNLIFVKNYFNQHDLLYEVQNIAGASDAAEATVMYAKENNPDMILIMVTKDISFADYMLGADEQKIISNPYKIPVMCINPVHSKYTASTGFTG